MYNDSIESVKQTLLVGSSPRRWICEVHREIYDLIESEIPDKNKRERLHNLIAEAYWMGKKMSDKLKDLKVKVTEEDDGGLNVNFEDDIYKRAARLNLLQNIKSLQIETISWCNRKCDWCPNKDLVKTPNMLMEVDVLLRVLRQLKEYGYKGDIHPYLNGEPFADKRILRICDLIKEYLPNNYLRVVTNGDYIKTTGDLDYIFAHGVDSLHINHYDGPFKDIRKARDKDYEKISHFGMAYLQPSFYNRAGQVEYEPTNDRAKGSCDWFLHKLFFNYKGDLVLCCSDFKYEVVFGNIMKQPLAAILNGDLYRKYYYAHKEGRGKEMPLCERCNHIL